jgi:hypothetical protein
MLAIIKMNLKVANRGFWTGRIQLARTVLTTDTRQEHPLDALVGLAWLGCCARNLGGGVHDGVFHYTFEFVVYVRRLLFEIGKTAQ